MIRVLGKFCSRHGKIKTSLVVCLLHARILRNGVFESGKR